MLNYYTAMRTKFGKLIDVKTGLAKKPHFTADMGECVALWGFLMESIGRNIRKKVRSTESLTD